MVHLDDAIALGIVTSSVERTARAVQGLVARYGLLMTGLGGRALIADRPIGQMYWLGAAL